LDPLVNVVHDVVCALTDLKIDLCLRLGHFKIERERIRLPDPSRAGEELTCCQKGEQRSEDRRSELRLAFHEIVLMTAEGGSSVMINVVLDEGDAIGRAEFHERGMKQLITRQIVGNNIQQM
jgi:hypothetical protein